jgi:hypothetical protein
MLLRALRLPALLVLGWIALVAQAQAATYVFSAPETSNPLDGGNDYSATFAFTSAAPSFTHNYLFNLVSSGDVPLNALTTSVAFEQPKGRIKNMFVSWLAPTTLSPLVTLQVTDGAGNQLASQMVLSLLSGAALGTYTLRVTGDAIASQIYNIAVTTTPLPPALLLFGSALAGLGLLGRRRRRATNTLAP